MSLGNLWKKAGLLRRIIPTCIVILLIQAASVHAFYIELSPSVTWGINYEDNINSLAQNQSGKLSGFSNRYTPALKFAITSSKLSVEGETRLDVSRYMTEKDYDNTDRFYKINGTYALSPRSIINISVNYTLNSNPERYLVTDAQGFQAGVLVRKTQDEIKSYSVSYDYALSYRSGLSLAFSYAVFSSQFNNTSDMYTYSASFKHDLTKKDAVTFSLGYNNFKYSYGLLDAANLGFKMDSYSISSGIAHKFSDTFDLEFNVGWYTSETKQRYAVVEENPDTGESVVTGTETLTNRTPGSNFSFILKKKYFHTDMQFRASQALGTNPDNGETYPSLNLGINIQQELAKKLQCSFFWSYFNNKASAGDYNNRREIDNSSFAGGVGLQYQYRRNIIFAVQYTRAESSGNSQNTAVRNTVFFNCTVNLQRPLIVR